MFGKIGFGLFAIAVVYAVFADGIGLAFVAARLIFGEP